MEETVVSIDSSLDYQKNVPENDWWWWVLFFWFSRERTRESTVRRMFWIDFRISELFPISYHFI